MKSVTIVSLLSLLAILITPTASATYYYDTEDVQQLVIAAAKRQKLPPSLALAIAKVESNFNPQALSHAGAKGVMQIMPRTAEQGFGVSRNRLFEADVNIELGVKFIKKLLAKYDGRLDIALSHYNGGSGVKNRHGELRVMPATQDYVNKVLSTQQDFIHHDNRTLFNSRVNRLANNYTLENAEKDLAEPQLLETLTEDPQIKTLRALRLHNITRNYKSKIAMPATMQTNHLENSSSVQASRNAKIAKVRQWESIYPD